MAAADQFKTDGEHRAASSLQALYRERICNPTYKYSINDAIGNPPIGSNDMQGGVDGSNFIKDASVPKLPRYDMFVPNGMLGASGIRRPHPEGCGLNIESGGCDPAKAPTYFDSSLWSWAYVTSSHDPDVAPGWHRLLYLKAFTYTACSANKGQTCKSQINRATVGDNFDFATQVAEQFRAEQLERYRDRLSTQLRPDLPLGSTNLRARRKLFVSPDGVYDLDAMISATEADPDLVEAGVDRNWGLSREEAALRFDLIRQQLKPGYVTSVINAGSADPVPAGFRTGQLALYAARCSDLLKKTFPEDQNVQCCLNAPEGQSCQPEQTYQSRPECNQGPWSSRTPTRRRSARSSRWCPGPLAAALAAALAAPATAALAAQAAAATRAARGQRRRRQADGAHRAAPVLRFGLHPERRGALLAPRLGDDDALRAGRRLLAAHAATDRRGQARGRQLAAAAAALAAGVFGGAGRELAALPSRNRRRPRSPPTSSATSRPTSTASPSRHAMALDNVRNTTREAVLMDITNSLHRPQWAQCSQALIDAGAVLPCRTGDYPHRCVDGARHCDTTWDNMHEPWIELDLRQGRPTDRDYHFFALEVALPADPGLAELFFESAQGVPRIVATSTTALRARGLGREPQPAAHAVQAVPQAVGRLLGGHDAFQYVCLDALADDAAFTTMRRAIALTLLGAYRMLWLMGTRAVARSRLCPLRCHHRRPSRPCRRSRRRRLTRRRRRTTGATRRPTSRLATSTPSPLRAVRPNRGRGALA